MSLTLNEIEFLTAAAKAANSAAHVFPDMAACEAALESAWGTSQLALQAHNLFGMKQQLHPVYGSISLPTREFLDQRWVTKEATWVDYPDEAAAFADRMATLRRLMSSFPHYCQALAAETPEEYVQAVSQSWSTDPDRAAKCIAIYQAHQDILRAALA